MRNKTLGSYLSRSALYTHLFGSHTHTHDRGDNPGYKRVGPISELTCSSYRVSIYAGGGRERDVSSSYIPSSRQRERERRNSLRLGLSPGSREKQSQRHVPAVRRRCVNSRPLTRKLPTLQPPMGNPRTAAAQLSSFGRHPALVLLVAAEREGIFHVD